MSQQPKHRKEFRNISVLALLPYIRMFPAAAWVSLLHRISGVLMFLLLPLVIWAFDASVSSEVSFNKTKNLFNDGWGFMPGWLLKLVVVALAWAYIYHLIAGLRFLIMDVNHQAVKKRPSSVSARVVLAISTVLTMIFALKVFGVY